MVCGASMLQRILWLQEDFVLLTYTATMSHSAFQELMSVVGAEAQFIFQM